MRALTALIFLVVGSHSFAHEMPHPEIPKSLENMKHLAGTWEGTSKMGGKDTNVTTVFEVTSGGTALVEKLMPGTPHEMITVFHKDGQAVSMEHYCSRGNQPHMALKKSDEKTFAFEMGNKPEGIASMKEEHMHAVTFTLVDADTLKEDWTNFKDGKSAEVATFLYHRKKN